MQRSFINTIDINNIVSIKLIVYEPLEKQLYMLHFSSSMQIQYGKNLTVQNGSI